MGEIVEPATVTFARQRTSVFCTCRKGMKSWLWRVLHFHHRPPDASDANVRLAGIEKCQLQQPGGNQIALRYVFCNGCVLDLCNCLVEWQATVIFPYHPIYFSNTKFLINFQNFQLFILFISLFKQYLCEVTIPSWDVGYLSTVNLLKEKTLQNNIRNS